MNEYGLKKKTRGQARQIRRVPVMTAAEAVKLVKDADVVIFAVPDVLIQKAAGAGSMRPQS